MRGLSLPAERGPLFLILACVLFSFNDSLVKVLSGAYPLHEIIFLRAIAALGILACVAWRSGGGDALRMRRPSIHLGRGLCAALSNASFFMGLASLPLAEAAVIFYLAPVFIAVFAGVFLRERIGLRGFCAIALGFAGAWLILRPGTMGLRWHSFLPLFAAAGYAMSNILGRVGGRTETAFAMSFYVHLSFLLTAAIWGLVAGDGRYLGLSQHPAMVFAFSPWRWPALADLLLMIGLGAVTSAGTFLSARAYGAAPASRLAPLEYTGLVVAVGLGWVFWNEWPGPMIFAGMALIVSAGLLSSGAAGLAGRWRARAR